MFVGLENLRGRDLRPRSLMESRNLGMQMYDKSSQDRSMEVELSVEN